MWDDLPLSQQWKKENVLAILSCETNTKALLKNLQEKKWEYYPSKRRHCELGKEEDIVLARLRRKEFPIYYRDKHDAVRAMIKKSGRHSKKVVVELARVLPSFWTCKDRPIRHRRIAASILSSPAAELSDVEKAVSLFSERLRRDVKFVHPDLRKDAAFALRVAEALGTKIADSLKHFSPNVKADKKVAFAFVRGSGQSYQNVAFSLRKASISLARVACQTFPTAALVKSVPGRIAKKLASDKKFMIRIFKGGRGCPTFWKILAPALKRDRDIILAAIASQSVDWKSLPVYWKADRELAIVAAAASSAGSIVYDLERPFHDRSTAPAIGPDCNQSAVCSVGTFRQRCRRRQWQHRDCK